MKSKIEFYQMLYEQLAKKGLETKKAISSDYIIEIYAKGQNEPIAFFTKLDSIEINPFIEVKDKLIDKIKETAKATALKCNICTEKPYEENNELLSNGSYKLAEFNNTILACKHHNLFGYVFSTYKESPENNQPIQRKFFYSKNDAMKDFAGRSGLVDEKQLFLEDELETIHDNLVKIIIMPNNNLLHNEMLEIDGIINKIEEIVPRLSNKDISYDLETSQNQKFEDLGFEV